MLVDSTVWIDYFNGTATPQTDLLDAALGRAPIVVGDLIVAEVLQGFRHEKDWQAARDALLRFPVLQLGGLALVLRSSQNYRELGARGITIRKTIDCLIATLCLEEGLTLLHNDRDFAPFVRFLGLREAV